MSDMAKEIEVVAEGRSRKYSLTYSQVARFPACLLSNVVEMSGRASASRYGVPDRPEGPKRRKKEEHVPGPSLVKIPIEHCEELPFVIEIHRTGSLLDACKQLEPTSMTTKRFTKLRATLDYFQLPTNEVLSLATLKKAAEGFVWPAPSFGSGTRLPQHTQQQQGAQKVASVRPKISAQFLGLEAFLCAHETAQGVMELVAKHHNDIACARRAKICFSAPFRDQRGVWTRTAYINPYEQTCIENYVCLAGTALTPSGLRQQQPLPDMKDHFQQAGNMLCKELGCEVTIKLKKIIPSKRSSACALPATKACLTWKF